MTTTEQKVFDIIRQKKNARVEQVARLAGMSSSYVDIVCRGLCRRGHINFTRGLAAIPASADSSEVATQEEPRSSESEPAFPILRFEGVSSELAKALEGAGCATVESLAETPISKLMSAGGMNVKQAADLINEARKKIGTIS